MRTGSTPVLFSGGEGASVFFEFFQVGLELLPAFAELLLQRIEFKQADAQLSTDQQHQAEGEGTDQAAGEHGDDHGRTAWSHVEQAEPGFADPATETIAEGGEHPTEDEQRQDEKPAAHRLLPAGMNGSAEPLGQSDWIQHCDLLAINLHQSGLAQVSQQAGDCDAG